MTGVIQMLNKNNKESFDDLDLLLLEEAAQYIALSIKAIYLEQETLDTTESIFNLARKSGPYF